MLIEEINNIKSTKKELREFGITVGAVIGLLGAILWWRGKEPCSYFLSLSAFLLILGLLFPIVLKPIQKIWMTIALIINWIMTRVILCFLFYLVVTPIGLLNKALGRNMLDLKFNKDAHSYWVLRNGEHFNKENYEKQF